MKFGAVSFHVRVQGMVSGGGEVRPRKRREKSEKERNRSDSLTVRDPHVGETVRRCAVEGEEPRPAVTERGHSNRGGN